MKICRQCLNAKPLCEFYLDRSMKNGYRSACKQCIREARRRHYIKHREVVLKQNKDYAESERGKEIRRRSNGARKQRLRTDEAFCEKEREAGRTPHARSLARKRWKRYAKTEKGIEAQLRAKTRRRSKLENIICDLTSEQWLDLLKQHQYRCAYCGREFDLLTQPTRDHVIPVSHGGNHTQANVVPACRRCNSSKGAEKWPKS